MIPVLFNIGPLSVYSYGLMLAAAVLACSCLMNRDARPLGLKPEAVYDLVFWTVLAGLLGARIFYIILNFEFYADNPAEIVMLQNGGLAIQGGLVAGAAVGIIQIRRMNVALPVMFDLAAPYLALGEAIGRIGCFLNGCCYGKPVAWGVYFPVHQDHLHPTQLYATAALFAIFLFLKRLPRTGAAGTVFAWYLCLEAVQRFVIEFYRGDHDVAYGGLSIYQLVCAGLFAVGLMLHSRLARPAR